MPCLRVPLLPGSLGLCWQPRWSIFAALKSRFEPSSAQGYVRVASSFVRRLLRLPKMSALFQHRKLPRSKLLDAFDLAGEHHWKRGRSLPFLFVLTFLRAMASCSSIWFCRCRSLFCSISSCDLKPRIAFLGVSFPFAPEFPPNQPHIVYSLMVSKL